MPSRDAYAVQSEEERRHPVLRCLEDPEWSQLCTFLEDLVENPLPLDKLQEAVLKAVPTLGKLYSDYPDTPPLFHCEETLEALERAQQEGRQACFLWKQLMCAKQSNPVMPLSPDADPGPTVDACVEQASHLRQYNIDVHIRDTAPVCIMPALKAGSARLGLAATRLPTARMLKVMGVFTSIEFVSLTAYHNAKVLLFEICGRWAMLMAEMFPYMAKLDLARVDPQSRLFTDSPVRVTVHSRVQRASRFIDLRSLLLLREIISDHLELGIDDGLEAIYARRAGGQESQLWSFSRLEAEIGTVLTDESVPALRAALRKVSEAAMKILSEKGTGLQGKGGFQGKTVHGGPRATGSGGCAIPAPVQPIAEEVSIRLAESGWLFSTDSELFERFEARDYAFMSQSLEDAGFVAEEDEEESGESLAAAFSGALPLLRLRAWLLATESPDATRFAEQELPRLPLHAINALLAIALEGAHAPDSDHEGLATFLARAKGFSVIASAPSENAGATPSPHSIPLGEFSPATPAESSPFDGQQSEKAVESYQRTHAEQSAAASQGEPEEDIAMEDDLGGEEPMFFMDQAGDLDEDSSAMAATTPPTSTLDSSSPFPPQSPAGDDETAPEPPRPQASLSSVLPTLHFRKISRARTITSDDKGDRLGTGSEEREGHETGDGPETDSAALNEEGSTAAEGVPRAPSERAVNPESAGEAENLRESVRPPNPNPNPPFSPASLSAAPPLAAAPNAETVGVAYSRAESSGQAFPSQKKDAGTTAAHAPSLADLAAVASTSSLSSAPTLPAITRPARWRIPAENASPSFSLESAPPLHSLRQYTEPAPTAANVAHPARLYGGEPSFADARTEVEILHEPLAPGQVTNIRGGGGYKNTSILRVVPDPRDDPASLRLPRLAELLHEACGDHYNDVKLVFIAPLPTDSRWLICKVKFKTEEGFVDYQNNRRKVAVAIIQDHNDRVIKASLAGQTGKGPRFAPA